VRKESQFLSKKMDEDMMELVNQGYERCKEVLGKNKSMLGELAELLL
jgi:ATP-dependent Zn protease